MSYPLRHGKGTVQDVIDLDTAIGKGEALGIYKVTTSEYYRVAGGSTQLRGVTPDVMLPDPTSWVDSDEGTLFHPLPWTSIGAADYVGRCASTRTRSLERWCLTNERGHVPICELGAPVRCRGDEIAQPMSFDDDPFVPRELQLSQDAGEIAAMLDVGAGLGELLEGEHARTVSVAPGVRIVVASV